MQTAAQKPDPQVKKAQHNVHDSQLFPPMITLTGFRHGIT